MALFSNLAQVLGKHLHRLFIALWHFHGNRHKAPFFAEPHAAHTFGGLGHLSHVPHGYVNFVQIFVNSAAEVVAKHRIIVAAKCRRDPLVKLGSLIGRHVISAVARVLADDVSCAIGFRHLAVAPIGFVVQCEVGHRFVLSLLHPQHSVTP